MLLIKKYYLPREGLKRLSTIRDIKRLAGSVLVIAILGFMGCNKQTEAFDEKYIQLYIDLKLMDVAWSFYPERATKMRKVILHQHEITEEQLSAFIAELKQDPERWKIFFDQVTEKTSKIQEVHKGG